MDSLTKKTLEFSHVLEIIEKYTNWQPAKEVIANLEPLDDLQDIKWRQGEVTEAFTLFEDNRFELEAEIFGEAVNFIKSCQKNKSLQPKELYSVLAVAKSSRVVNTYLRSHLEDLPLLADRALRLGVFRDLEKKLNKALTADGELSPNASPALSRYRETLAASRNAVEEGLRGILRDSRYSRMIQEPVVITRFERDVIPIKAEYRTHFPGIIIDQSSSGATLFMEPLSVVELSNAARSAALAEKAEINRILQSLSEEIGKLARPLLDSVTELIWLEALQAITKYSIHSQSQIIPVEEGIPLRLMGARHPLLIEKLGTKVVPTTFELTEDLKILIMTGPNTGGKTVALKTVGLTVMLAMAGLPIPADSGSQIPFIEQIWADIGDEQNIMQNLSTFSAHMNQIIKMLPQAGERTLVLLDELGSGTDPVDGGALAEAVLEYLLSKKTLTFVTTHLSELKKFAAKNEGMSNAAMEFNSQTLEPTYRIIMGVPGRSNALQIASNLGLPSYIERRALELLGGDDLHVEGLLSELDREREINERLAKKLRDQLSQMGRLRSNYEQKIAQAEDECMRMRSEASQESRELMETSRRRIHDLTANMRRQLSQLLNVRRQSIVELRSAARQLAEALVNFEALEELVALNPVASRALSLALQEVINYKRSHDGSVNSVSTLPSSVAEVEDESVAVAYEDVENIASVDKLDKFLREQARLAEGEFDDIGQRSDEVQKKAGFKKCKDAKLNKRFQETTAQVREILEDPQEMEPSEEPQMEEEAEINLPLEVGSHVFVARYGQDGTVLSLSEKKAEVQIGVIRVKVKREDLQVLAPEKSEIVSLPKSGGMSFLSSRIDLHGMNVSEALWDLGAHIDKAFMSGVRQVEIIHGIGTGTLRKAVWEYVKNHPSVASYRIGKATEGGIGATIVELNN